MDEPPTTPSADGPVTDTPATGPTDGLRRVHPGPSGPTTVAEAYGYDVARSNRARRPWVAVCMVASLDGAIAVGGASGPLGNETDLEVLLTLRDLADVVIVGAGTARGEGYGAPRSGVRIGVVTNSGRVDTDAELFRSGAGFLITTDRADVSGHLDVLRAGSERVDLAGALGRLTEIVPGVTRVHAEGGPTLNGALLDADLVDELNLTVAPALVGGDSARATSGAAERLRRFELAHLLVDDDGYTFGRWVRDPARR